MYTDKPNWTDTLISSGRHYCNPVTAKYREASCISRSGIGPDIMVCNYLDPLFQKGSPSL